MNDLKDDRRRLSRNYVALPAVVKGRESKDDFWKEKTEIVTVSRLGASFNLDHECKVGRILSLIVKMPENLRCYDQDKNLYRVWGLVQHCSPISQASQFLVGIAFIGKFAPKSYLDDPLRTYRIVGMDEDGFWNVGATKAPFVSRAHHRFPCALGVKIAVVDVDGTESQIDFDAVTENISAGGASVFSNLRVETGDAVNFRCESNGFTSLAVVRNRQKREGDRVTIHVEFSGDEFPIMDLDLSFEDGEDVEREDLNAGPIPQPGTDLDAENDVSAETIDTSDTDDSSEGDGVEEEETGVELELDEINPDESEGIGETHDAGESEVPADTHDEDETDGTDETHDADETEETVDAYDAEEVDTDETHDADESEESDDAYGPDQLNDSSESEDTDESTESVESESDFVEEDMDSKEPVSGEEE